MQPPTSRFYTAESSLDTQAQLLPRQIADSTLRFRPFLSDRSPTDASSFSSSRWQTDLLQSLPCLSFGSLFTKADCKQTQPSLVQPIAPPRRSQFHHRLFGARSPPSRLLLPEHWAETVIRRGEGRRRTSRYTTTVRTMNSPYTSRHTCNVQLPNNLAKHAFNGGSGLILYLITH